MRTHHFLVALPFLAACGVPLFHAPPRPVHRTALVPPPVADSEIVVIAMHRGPCFGRCRAYGYSFARGGRALRQGIAHTDFPRCAKTTLPAGAFEDLARRLLASGFFDRDSLVGPVITDVSYLSVTAILLDGRGHMVRGAQEPPELAEISVAIDSIGALVSWDSVPEVHLGGRRRECPWGVNDVGR